MKIFKQILAALIIIFIMVIVGCEYDGPTAQWSLVEEETDPPTITGVDPSVAVAGVNYLTINGENFTDNQEKVSVFINGYNADIVSFSNSSIKIRRPDCSGDSLSIKVDVYGAVNLGIWEPYTIAPVYEPHGQFLGGLALGCLAIDEEENVYVVESSLTRDIHKITASGERTQIGNSNYAVRGAATDPNGKLYLFANRKDIYVVESDTVPVYATVSKNVSTGVFDDHGTLYASGRRADINIILPDLSVKQADLYARDELFCLRVFNNYLYALIELRDSDESHPELAIWRHQILDNQGNLGDAELVFDWASAGEAYEKSDPATFTLDSEGKVYIGSDNVAPILYYDPSTGDIEEIYKGIIPAAAEKLLCGSGNYLYMVYSGNDLFRIDLGNPEDRDF